jgi:hypothetical protein
MYTRVAEVPALARRHWPGGTGPEAHWRCPMPQEKPSLAWRPASRGLQKPAPPGLAWR